MDKMNLLGVGRSYISILMHEPTCAPKSEIHGKEVFSFE